MLLLRQLPAASASSLLGSGATAGVARQLPLPPSPPPPPPPAAAVLLLSLFPPPPRVTAFLAALPRREAAAATAAAAIAAAPRPTPELAENPALPPPPGGIGTEDEDGGGGGEVAPTAPAPAAIGAATGILEGGEDRSDAGAGTSAGMVLAGEEREDEFGPESPPVAAASAAVAAEAPALPSKKEVSWRSLRSSAVSPSGRERRDFLFSSAMDLSVALLVGW